MMCWSIFRILHPIKRHIDSKIMEMWWLYLMGDQRAGVFGSLLQDPSSSGRSLQLVVCWTDHVKLSFHVFSGHQKKLFLAIREQTRLTRLTRPDLFSPYMSFSEMLFWLGQGALVFVLEAVRELKHSCLFSHTVQRATTQMFSKSQWGPVVL